MPSADEIVNGLATIANSWRWLAILWHAYMGVFAVSLLFGWRPSKRLAGALLIPSVVSVSALAWVDGNPFNGTTFALLSVVLLASLIRSLTAETVEVTCETWLAAGALLIGFGYVYPHFLNAESAYVYLFAAPLGLVPCPTLAMVIGFTIILSGLGSRVWSLALVVAGLFYGAFGALYLGVNIDWVLTAGALSLFAFLVRKEVVGARR